MSQPKGFDPECKKLAEYFLEEGETPVDEKDIADLAQSIQDAIEDWLGDHDQRLFDAGEAAREGRWAK